MLLEKERADLKESTLERLKEGQIVEGMVKNITDYGAFIDLGGIDGLLHITDMSLGPRQPPERAVPGRRPRPREACLEVQRRHRARQPRPQADHRGSVEPAPSREVHARHGASSGKVVSLKDYGAFIELEEGIEGLVHVSEMSWTRRVKHPSKIVAVGDRSRRSCSTST